MHTYLLHTIMIKIYFQVHGRKCIRRLLNVPNTTNCRLLPLILDDIPVDQQLHRRFTEFISSCLHSSNSLVRICSFHAFQGSRSSVANSIIFMYHAHRIHRVSWPNQLKVPLIVCICCNCRFHSVERLYK